MIKEELINNITDSLYDVPGFDTLWTHDFRAIMPFKKFRNSSPKAYFTFLELFIKEYEVSINQAINWFDDDTSTAIVSNYILGHFFILTCLDTLIQSLFRSGKSFAGWEFNNCTENFCGSAAIYFNLVNKEKDSRYAQIIIQLPYIKTYAHEYEQCKLSISKFLNTTKCVITIVDNESHSVMVADEFLTKNFTNSKIFLTVLEEKLESFNKKVFGE